MASILIIFSSTVAQTVEVYFSKDVNIELCDSLGIDILPDGWNVRLDSLLAEFIDNAEYSVDMCVYNFDVGALEFLAEPIENAVERGIKFRCALDSPAFSDDSVISFLSSLDIPFIRDDFGGGSRLMHCKFFIIDGRDSDTTNDISIISSCNLTANELNHYANNTVVIYSHSLASILTEQFNIYWGCDGDLPDSTNSNFSTTFPDVDTHIISYEDIYFEIYFSPLPPEYQNSVLRAFSQATEQLYFSIYRFTNGEAIDDTMKKLFLNGTDLRGVFDIAGGIANVYADMKRESADTTNWWEIEPPVFIDSLDGGSLHHKYMIANPNCPELSPFVLTGSMNWSDAGFHSNNECVLIIHSYEVAQKFLAEFATRYFEAGGTLSNIIQLPSNKPQLRIYPNPTREYIHIQPARPIAIYDIRGNKLGDFTSPVYMGDFPAGFYLIDDGENIYRILLIH